MRGSGFFDSLCLTTVEFDDLDPAMFALLLCALTAMAAESGPRFDGSVDPRRPVVSVTLPAELAGAGDTWLKLVRIEGDKADSAAIFGSYTRRGEVLSFVPAFRLSPGTAYRAILKLPGRDTQSADYTVPAAEARPTAALEKIYPTADHVPANLLKFYLYFSQPMRETEGIFDHFQILGADGQAVHDPWRRQSLWSDDGRRLTLLIHPGRIKRGVNLREELGPVLRPGQRYTLVIDEGALDAGGRPIGKRYEKQFTADDEVSRRLTLARWQLELPQAGTTEPLRITFNQALDHALARRLIRVKNAAGEFIAGQVALGSQERSCSFTPAQPWRKESYLLTADDLLEDLAGNTPSRVFDADLENPDIAEPMLERAFELK